MQQELRIIKYFIQLYCLYFDSKVKPEEASGSQMKTTTPPVVAGKDNYFDGKSNCLLGI